MAEFTQKDIEFLFQEQVLEQHGEYLSELFYETLERKNIRVTDDLYESIDFSNFKEGENRGLRFNFFTYGRFIEIRKHRRQAESKRNRFEKNSNALLWGIKENKFKNTDWYSKNAYGSLNRLISILMNELSDKEVERLKEILSNGTYHTYNRK